MKVLLKGKLIAASTAVLILIAMVVLAAHAKAKAKPKAPGPPEVEVAPVVAMDVPIYHEWIGTLTGLVNANIKAQVTGYLLRQDYKEGSFVKKGQLLFEIDPRPFQAALDRAKGQFAQARAQLAQDQAQLAVAKANQVKSQLNVNRYRPLAKAQAASEQDLDNAVQTNLANEAQAKAAKAAIATAQAQIQVAQAQIETARINLNFTRVTSPIDGIAGVAKAQVGDLVSPASGVLTTVSTVNPIKDYFAVSEQEYLALRRQFPKRGLGQLKLQLILSDGSVYPREGEFFFADRAVDPNTGDIELAGLFPNPGNILRPGEYGKVRAVAQIQKHALLVPQRAVTELQGSYHVDVLGRDNRVAIQPVQVGERVGAKWIIQSGLSAGQSVVAEGLEMLRPGMKVEPEPFKGSGD
ncbi:MAG: efflux RND transporter periplasmic adaptor subunit [Terriglobia bacterium]